jgi:AraC-like DNA-binding protein
METALPELVQDQSFADMSQVAKAVNWDLDFRQLDAGPLDARTSVIAAPRIQITRFNFNRSFHQVGNPPANLLTFGVLGVDVSDITWCSRPLQGGAIVNFNLDSGFECVSQSDFLAYGLSLDIELIQALANQMGITTPVDELAKSQISWFSPHTQGLCRKLSTLFAQAGYEKSTGLHENAAFINEEIGQSLLRILSGPDHSETIESPAHRQRVLRRSMEILADPENLPITVSKLCEAAYTSLSTLHRAFQAEFDVSPKAYIRARCLSAVRDELASAPPDTRVSEIANRWGFWHMGQFAKDFKNQFGHLPSEIKRRSFQAQ